MTQPKNKFLKRYFAITEIDKVISRYRSKLHYEIEKISKKKKSIDLIMKKTACVKRLKFSNVTYKLPKMVTI